MLVAELATARAPATFPRLLLNETTDKDGAGRLRGPGRRGVRPAVARAELASDGEVSEIDEGAVFASPAGCGQRLPTLPVVPATIAPQEAAATAVSTAKHPPLFQAVSLTSGGTPH
jgi:hypothetical protein